MTLKHLTLLLILLLITSATELYSQRQSPMELANQYASTGECEKAVVYYEQWYRTDPYNAYQPFLNCYLQLKDYSEAEKLIKKQMKRMSTNPVLWVDLGQLYSLQGKEDLATQQYEKAIKSLFPDVNQINNLGNAFLEKRMTNYAELTYFQGRKLLDNSYPFGFELAEVYARSQQPEKMVEEYIGMLDYNIVYLPNIQTILQNKIAFDLEGGISDLIRTSLLRRIQKGNQPTVFNELLFWLLLQEKDFDSALIQAKALDRRNNESGSRLISLGQLAVSNEQYAVAEECFDYVLSLGKNNVNYVTARMELIMARDRRITQSGAFAQADLLKLESEYALTIEEVGKNQISAPIIGSYAYLKAFYLEKIDEAIALLEEIIAIPRISPQFVAQNKLVLGDILILKGEVWEASLLFSQVDKDFKNDAIGREAKYRNARLSYFMGEFEWAAAQLNVLKSATSQLISNDAMQLSLLIMDNLGFDSITDPLLMYSRADLFEFCNRYDQSLATLDSLLTLYPGHSLTDEILFRQAGIYFKKGDYQKAGALYLRVFETFPDDILGDDALYKLASLTETKVNDQAQAKQLYEMFINKYPGSLYIVDVRKRYRQLRGDAKPQ